MWLPIIYRTIFLRISTQPRSPAWMFPARELDKQRVVSVIRDTRENGVKHVSSIILCFHNLAYFDKAAWSWYILHKMSSYLTALTRGILLWLAWISAVSSVAYSLSGVSDRGDGLSSGYILVWIYQSELRVCLRECWPLKGWFCWVIS